MFALVTWRSTGCGLIVCVGDLDMDRMWIDSWRRTGCGLILDHTVCVGDLEMYRMWIDS